MGYSWPASDDSAWERIDGERVPRPAPGRRHAQAQGAVYVLLREQTKTLFDFEVQVEWSLVRPDHAHADEPDYMTADVLIAERPFRLAANDHLIGPAFLAVEIVSPQQPSLFSKAQRYVRWGVPHVWIIDPLNYDCFEFHGGDTFRRVEDELRAGQLTIGIAALFAEIDNPVA